MIVMASHVGHIRPSDDCKLYQILLPAHEQVGLMPYGSYGTCGWLHLFMHPIFRIEGDALILIEQDFRAVEFRSSHTPETYREEAIMQAMRSLYLDVMNAHAAIFGGEEVSMRSADIMSRFIRMLETGTYRQYRTVAYYARELCVTPKHLHRISTEVSGRAPSYWIRQFTMMEIKHLLKHGKLTAKEVAGKMNFDSVSHFSRYISEHLKISQKA